MDHEQSASAELQLFLIGLFPTTMRISALQNKEFRDRLGLSLDANIRLDQIGAAFKRSVLFATIRDLLSLKTADAQIEDTEKVAWLMSIDTERARITIATESRRFFIPDFSCLHPDEAERLKWFDQEVRKFGVNDARMQKWREVLKERSVEDEEVDELLKEFRLTPRYVNVATKNQFRRETISAESLVPDDLRYFDRLVGEAAPRMGLKEFYETFCGIRGKAATDSDGRRPPIPIESGHPIRTKAATLLIG